MSRIYFLDSAQEAVAALLDKRCRVYYIDKGKSEVYEYTSKDPLTDLSDAEKFIVVQEVKK